METRENIYLARVIQQAIIIDATAGAAQAWVYLETHEVPKTTILRVLSNHERRRATDFSPQPV